MGVGVVAVLITISACSSSTPATQPVGDCPVAPRSIVVSIDQWRELVTRLAGDCGRVTTILTTSADPHDYEPTPSDIAMLGTADLVVKNGLGYDSWVDRSLAAGDHRARVVDVGRAVGPKSVPANPHRWYRPADVHAVARAVTAQLTRSEPRARTYFRDRARRWRAAMDGYDQQVTALTAKHSGRQFAATEGVFDLMAGTLGLVDRTPGGYRRAASNGSEPGPADLAEFESRLREGNVDVLIVNDQTAGSVPRQLRRVAIAAGVPVVEVTESQPAKFTTFAAWQRDQLTRLDQALSR